MSEPELTNPRAEREWAYLCRLVGEERARAAIERIPGTRKAYPLNIARALGVKLPPEDQLPSVCAASGDVARSEISAMRAILGRKGS